MNETTSQWLAGLAGIFGGIVGMFTILYLHSPAAFWTFVITTVTATWLSGYAKR